QVAAALAAAHAKGVIHCDLKPDNIMLRPDGLVKVLDLGLSRRAANGGGHLAADGVKKQASTSCAEISGTIGYLAPELLEGLAPDARADLWSFGVVLFEMLAGHRPFQQDTIEGELRGILHGQAPVLSSLRSDVPLGLAKVISRALARSRDERYQSVDEVIADLKHVEDQLGLPSARAIRWEDSHEQASEKRDQTFRSAARSSPGAIVAKRLPYMQRHRRWLLHSGWVLILLACANVLWMPREGVVWLTGAPFVLASLCLVAWILLRRTRSITPPAQSLHVAFRGLLPFQEADREHFYGRDLDTRALYGMVTHQIFRFGVLFGDSGSGKTSLLRAGVVPRLWEQGFVPLYFRSFTDPLVAVMEECRKRSRLDFEAGESPVVYLRRASRKLDAPLVIICDQFEEFFVNFKTADQRAPFIDFVAACQERSDLPVKFLFSLRSDFLYLINSAFSGRVPEPLLSNKLYHLHNFDEEVAAEIIERSASAAGFPFEYGLNRQIARDLAVNHAVAPSEMQIVGAQLQARHVFTFDAYRRTGGKEALVQDFLEDLIKASGEADSARLLLRSLISEENTRLTLSIAEICKRTQRHGETVSRLLKLFTEARLVRELQEEEPWRYELIHEYLIDKINRVTGQVLDATQRANRHFRQYLVSYSLDHRTRLPLTKLWSIRRYSDLPRGARERELLRKSARSGILRAAVLVLSLGLITATVAAYLSAGEQWQSVRLSDGHTASARHLVFSPDGQRLVSCGEDGKVIVWDFPARQRIATLTEHQGWVNWVDYSPDGKWFATASQDQTVIIWNAVTLQKTAVLREHLSGVSSVTVSPDGKWLVSTSADNDSRVVLWAVDGWRKVSEIAYGLKFGQLVFTRDSGRLIGPGGWTWEVPTGSKLSEDMPGVGNYGSLDAAGKRFLTIEGTGYVSLMDLAQRKVTFRTRGHQFHGRVAIFSPDGRLWATGSEDIVLWDAATQTKILRLPYVAEVWGLAFSPDGRWLVASYTDGAILLWDVKEREVTASFNEHSGSVRAVAFSPDGRRLASASEDKSVIIWNASQSRKESTLLGHHTRVTALAFGPGGDWLVSSDQDGHMIRWDLKQSRPIWEFTHPRAGFPDFSVAVSADGRWIAHSTGITDSATGRLVADFYALPVGQIYGLAFSPDGNKLAYTVLDSAEHRTWRTVEQIQLKDLQLICVKFSPDGRNFVTGEDEGVLRLWQTDGLRQLAVIGRHTARIKAIDFSPDGSELVSAADDQTISLWNVERRRLITHLGTHTAPVLAVDFAPDGKRIAAGGQDKSTHIYIRHRTLWGYNLD
ncbi:MAG: protein kinase, partial [Pyrinomonadaceae bacterium]